MNSPIRTKREPREGYEMMRDFRSKDIIYLFVLVVIVVCFVTMIMEKVDICFGLISFMVSLVGGLFYLMFFDDD